MMSSRKEQIKKIMDDVKPMYITDRLRVLRLIHTFNHPPMIISKNNCESADGSRVNLDKLTDDQIKQISELVDAIPGIIERYKI